MRPRTGKLEDEYAWATECQLATLSGLCWVKRSALVEITRQRNISYHMLTVCQEHAGNITWGLREFGRVQDILKDAKESDLMAALNHFTMKCFDKPELAQRWLKSFENSEKGRIPH